MKGVEQERIGEEGIPNSWTDSEIPVSSISTSTISEVLIVFFLSPFFSSLWNFTSIRLISVETDGVILTLYFWTNGTPTLLHRVVMGIRMAEKFIVFSPHKNLQGYDQTKVQFLRIHNTSNQSHLVMMKNGLILWRHKVDTNKIEPMLGRDIHFLHLYNHSLL